jgi:methylenetetrahydrofolate reductase (NADPH)
MRFAEIYAQNQRPIFSFEVFPPKTEAAYDSLKTVLPQLVALKPDFMTVTYGALGSTRDRTLEIATLIRNRYGLETACHLTCVGSSRSDIDRLLDQIRAAGLQNIVALRGDPPQGQTTFVPAPDGFSHANELVIHIRSRQAREGWEPLGIGVAGYPEVHVEAPSLAADLTCLKRKVEAGADAIITQLFYDNQFYHKFVAEARALGIKAPIIPGLLPILSAKQVLRITQLCRCHMPTQLIQQLTDAGDDLQASEEIGVRQCVAQAKDLIAHGVPGIHFYVFNKASHLTRILAELR